MQGGGVAEKRRHVLFKLATLACFVCDFGIAAEHDVR